MGLRSTKITPGPSTAPETYANNYPQGTVVRLAGDDLWMVVRDDADKNNRWMNLINGYLGEKNSKLTGRTDAMTVLTAGDTITMEVR